jgi:hypothetical protein
MGLGKIHDAYPRELAGRSGGYFGRRKRPMGFCFVFELFVIARTIGVAVRYRA